MVEEAEGTAADHLLLEHPHRHHLLGLLHLTAHLLHLQHHRHHHRLRRPHHQVQHLVIKIGELKDSQALMEEVLVGAAVVEAIAGDLQELMSLLSHLQLINNNNNNNSVVQKRIAAIGAVVRQIVLPAAAVVQLQNSMSHGFHHIDALHHLLRLQPKTKRG